MSAVAVGGAVWTLAVGTVLLVVGLLVQRVDRWAHVARLRRGNRRVVSRHRARWRLRWSR